MGAYSQVFCFIMLLAYFGMELGDQDKLFAPHICYKTCEENSADGVKEKQLILHLVFQWYGEKERTTFLTAIFA